MYCPMTNVTNMEIFRVLWSYDIVTKCLKAGIEESLPRQLTEAFPLQRLGKQLFL
jgi:hypothetical protein